MTSNPSCQHPVIKQKIWRSWTTVFDSAPDTKVIATVVLQCECGERTTLETKLLELSS